MPAALSHPSLRPMESQTDRLRYDLRRYRSLLQHTLDARAKQVLREMIGELETRLRVVERDEWVASARR
jgi:hypothetical protein